MKITLIAETEADKAALEGDSREYSGVDNWVLLGQISHKLENVAMWSGDYGALLMALMSATENLKFRQLFATMERMFIAQTLRKRDGNTDS